MKFIMPLLFAIVFSNASHGQQRETIPSSLLNIDGIRRYVRANAVSSVDEFMEHLPDLIRSNYVLVENSVSRQRPSTAEYPRIVLFVPDGSLFLGIATNPKSSGYDEVELLERTDRDIWRLGALDLSGKGRPVLHTGGGNRGSSCNGCHGGASRPIWGSYPTWPGVFGDGAGHNLSKTQADALTKVLIDEKHPNKRLRKLEFVKATWSEGDTFILPERHRNLSNEAFSDAVGVGHANVLWKHVSSKQHFELLLQAHLVDGIKFFETNVDGKRAKAELQKRIDRLVADRGTILPRGATLSDKAIRLLDLQAYRDLFLRATVPALNREKPEPEVIYLFQGWNFIATWIGDLVTVRYLLYIHNEHPQYGILQSMASVPHEAYPKDYPSAFAYLRDSTSYMFESSLEKRLELHKERVPPTVNLRAPHLFSASVQRAIGPKLVRLIDATVAKFDAE